MIPTSLFTSPVRAVSTVFRSISGSASMAAASEWSPEAAPHATSTSTTSTATIHDPPALDVGDNVSVKTLTLLTWNIWFDSYAFVQRMNIMSSCISRLDPDVICLQEVLPHYVKSELHKQPWTHKYTISDPGDASTIGSYGVLMLCKKHLRPSFSWVDFPSGQGRSLLMASMEGLPTAFAVGTVHLESLNKAPLRRRQFEISISALREYKNAVLCGDFNFCSHRNYSGVGKLENDCIEECAPDYVDVWPALRGVDPGYTFNSDINRNIHQTEMMRYDRIIFKSGGESGNHFEPSNVGNPTSNSPPASALTAGDSSVWLSSTKERSASEWIATDIRLIGGIAGRPEAEPCGAEATTNTIGSGIAPSVPVDGFSTPPPMSNKRLHVDTCSSDPNQTIPGLFASDHFGLFATFTYRS